MYEILTGSPLYKDIANDDAEKRFERSQFPDNANLGAGDVILRFWNGQFNAVSQVETELKTVTITTSLIDI